MAYDPTIAPQYVGGGYGGGFGGGWGGGYGFGGGGILEGLILGAVAGGRGFFGGRDGKDGCCDCTKHQLDMIDSNLGDMRTQINLDTRFNDTNDTINSRFNSIEAKQNTMQIEGQIAALGGRMDTFKDFALTAFGDIKTGQALLGKDVVIAEKNIMHNQDKCCCEILRNDDAHFAALQHQADKNTCAILKNDDENTQKVLNKLCDQETARLRDEIAELRNFRNIRHTADIVAATTVKATTNGSNFNTGLQTQSNNSGQIVG